MKGERGCGHRTAGGIYIEVPTSALGVEIEFYICDPPIEISTEAIGVSPVGVTLYEHNGVVHVIDWVGEEHYPNVADFIEEARAMGVSRRIPKNIDFSKLTSQSMLILMHRKAVIPAEWRPIYWREIAAHGVPLFNKDNDYGEGNPICAAVYRYKRLNIDPERANILHDSGASGIGSTCSRLWYSDVIPFGQPDVMKSAALAEASASRSFTRQIPSLSYPAYLSPQLFMSANTDGARQSETHRPAVFAKFPISRIVQITGDAKDSQQAARIAIDADAVRASLSPAIQFVQEEN